MGLSASRVSTCLALSHLGLMAKPSLLPSPLKCTWNSHPGESSVVHITFPLGPHNNDSLTPRVPICVRALGHLLRLLSHLA